MIESSMNDEKEVERIMGFIHDLIEDRDELKRWKEEQLQVESEWNPQRVGDLLGINQGRSIRENLNKR